MTSPKAYIYEFDNLKAAVCSYSIDLFNLVLKTIRSDSEVYTKELDMVSHKTHHKSACNCKETIKDLCIRMSGKLKTFEKVVVPLEFLELELGSSHLLICEIYKTSKKSGCKFTVINTTMRNKRDVDMKTGSKDTRPKYCLLKLYMVFNHDLLACNDSAGRNNSLSSKAAVLKDCYKEIARELAGKGALPRDLSQKCLHTRDTNRCWFDYGRIMDICIGYKLSAKDIAELIKHIAAIDPMQPDPVMCIKGRLGLTGSRTLANIRKKEMQSDSSNKFSSSQSSSEKYSSSSSSKSELIVCKSRSSSKMRRRNSREPCGSKKKSHKSISRHLSKETQTLNCTQRETQTDLIQCRCCRVNTSSQANDGSYNKYLWTPDYYDDQNDYEEPMAPYNDCLDEQEILDEDDDMGRDIDYDNPTNVKEEDYDSHVYDDFIKQSQYLENVQDDIPNCLADIDEPPLYGASSADCSPSGLRRRLNSLNTRPHPSMKFHMKAPPNIPMCAKYVNLDTSRSNSQPVLPTKNRLYHSISNSNNSQDQSSQRSHDKVKIVALSKTAVESSTQTLAPSPNNSIDTDGFSQVKKYPSEANVLEKECLNNLENHYKGEHKLPISHVGVNTCLSLNASKSFKMEAVQTDFESFPRDDEFFGSQGKYDSLIPRFMYRRRMNTKSNYGNNDKQNIMEPPWKEESGVVEDNYRCNRMIYDDMPISLNRNDNNHSISRSPSSRNSQIVEVDNENMERIPSVIVDQDSRPIIYCNSNNQGTIYNIDHTPFYEESELYPASDNININNSIRSVTVSNMNPSTVNLTKCSITDRATDGYNHACTDHTPLISRACSPERCLSRLSCMVSLNRQMLENNLSPALSSSHITALRYAMYGSCDDLNCLQTEPEHQPHLLPHDNQPLLSLNNINRRFVRTTSSLFQEAKYHYLITENKPLHSALKMSNGHFVECYPLDLNSASQRYISQLNKAQNVYQSVTGENIEPINSLPCIDCRNAAVSRCLAESHLAACSNNPLSNIALLSGHHEEHNPSIVNTPQYRLLNEEVIGNSMYRPASQNRQNMLSDSRVINNRENQPPHGRLSHSCNLNIPLNLQACPVSGCRNITTTGQPPCQQLRFSGDQPKVTSSCLTLDIIRQPVVSEHKTLTSQKVKSVTGHEQNYASMNSSLKEINHSQLHNYNMLDNNEIIYNDPIIDTTSNHFSTHDDAPIPSIMLSNFDSIYDNITSLQKSNSAKNSASLHAYITRQSEGNETQSKNCTFVNIELNDSNISTKISFTSPDSDLDDPIKNDLFITKPSLTLSGSDTTQSTVKNIKKQSVTNISVYNLQRVSPKNPCWESNDIYSTMIIKSVLTSSNLKNNSGLSSNKPFLNNSSTTSLNNRQSNLDCLYIDCLPSKIRSRIFSDSFLLEESDNLLMRQWGNRFFSSQELILNRHPQEINVAERCRIESGIVLETLCDIVLMMSGLLDQHNDTTCLLLSSCMLFNEGFSASMKMGIQQSTSKKCAISRILKFIKPKEHSKTERMKEFKNKMLKILKKCRNRKQRCPERCSGPLSISADKHELAKLLCSNKSSSEKPDLITSTSKSCECEFNVCTQSCIDLGILSKIRIATKKRWTSEPELHRFYSKKTNSQNTLQRLIFSSTAISTSDLSLLCVEVLRKMENKCILNPGRIDCESSSGHTSNSTTSSNREPRTGSSKDTLQLIIKAFKYLNHSQLEDSGPSNKTLDSVSSIKTCSGGRLDSRQSVRQRITCTKRPKQTNISAYNKML